MSSYDLVIKGTRKNSLIYYAVFVVFLTLIIFTGTNKPIRVLILILLMIWFLYEVVKYVNLKDKPLIVFEKYRFSYFLSFKEKIVEYKDIEKIEKANEDVVLVVLKNGNEVKLDSSDMSREEWNKVKELLLAF